MKRRPAPVSFHQKADAFPELGLQKRVTKQVEGTDPPNP